MAQVLATLPSAPAQFLPELLYLVIPSLTGALGFSRGRCGENKAQRPDQMTRLPTRPSPVMCRTTGGENVLLETQRQTRRTRLWRFLSYFLVINASKIPRSIPWTPRLVGNRLGFLCVLIVGIDSLCVYLCFVYLYFETESYYIALISLKFTMQTRLVLNLKI